MMLFTRYISSELNNLPGKDTLENWRRGPRHLISPLCVMLGEDSATQVKISQLVNKMCSQQACSKLANKL
jgi:hypothetical protein